jgi:hypothetical protein
MSKHNVSEIQLSRFYLRAEIESSLRNAVLKYKQDNILDKDETVDNAQERINCTSFMLMKSAYRHVSLSTDFLKCEVLAFTSRTVRIVFWDVTQCSLLNTREAFSLHALTAVLGLYLSPKADDFRVTCSHLYYIRPPPNWFTLRLSLCQYSRFNVLKIEAANASETHVNTTLRSVIYKKVAMRFFYELISGI